MGDQKAEEAVRALLDALGEDADREGLKRTPERVAKLLEEFTSGRDVDPAAVLTPVFSEEHDEMILVKDIPFASLCDHHLVPFVGKAHVGYIPNKNGRVTGLSKLARVVDICSRRLQMQERLTTQVADAIEQALDPRGVIVVVEAEHMCMSMRGVQKPGHLTVTSAVRGVFRENVATRAEAMTFIRGTR
ncbi:MAG TPA: GTP cyclohydrolase I FolE [Actinomycetota bacterium]|jgi:GTP cyclohydrolase I|nr:GTP cyclohydrolase I FolE [Actinomycetota bacterium]